ncbi:DNA polymerase III subunit alpha [Gracilibacillus alcaliphilus]|uniref:DNA polymerase III subunit alpha n=1 Tax=Gracilibacillus alcaliphilus TaxID=1401441 RepID=UPI001957AA02|nr:DNA polymerase III subunit alpha [Gracilibacillus alcaliphilus]MBM7676900.1 DNA polymerase-3 subunit alpha [Gracilibacillus alcaliphilus]
MAFQAQLQITTGYSLMKSTIQIPSLVKEAKQKGYTHLAITDEDTVHGLISFYQTCLREQIQPILGMTSTIQIEGQPVRIISLAANNEGYQQLLQLSSDIQHGQMIDFETYQTYLNGLITIVPADQFTSSEWQDYSERLQVLEHVYLGISASLLTEQAVLEALEIQKVALADVRYLHKHDRFAYSCLQAMSQGAKWNRELLEGTTGTFLPSTEEFTTVFQQWPEIIETTNRLAQECQLELPLGKKYLPKYPLPNDEQADNYLKAICQSALSSKYTTVTEEITNRLNHELAVIQSMGFSDYFLIVWDFVKYAKEQEILVGPGRGSAAGSIVAYLLGITTVDPIQYGLLFERFLNPERVTLPDIDIDFSDEKRDTVIRYVADKYGAQHVAQIVTFGTFAARSLLRELFKVLSIEENDQVYILRLLPKDSTMPIAAMLKQSKELMDYVTNSEKLRQLFRVCNCLEGLPRHLSTHAAGVVISDDELTKHTATMPSQHDITLTQFAMNELERVGLLKFDFLGLRNLTIIERMTKQIARIYKRKIITEELALDDPDTFQLLQRGETNGIFQLESQGMQQVLKELRPTEFEDIVAVNALYRPGPMAFIPTYVARKHKQEKVTYLHDNLKPILSKTYGVLVYQEQIIQIVHQMAGFTYGQADMLRRAVSKKDKELLMSNKQAFLNGSRAKGYTESVAEEVFAWIVRFSDYGFNRSHAVAYSMITYQLAYFKANYPLVFYNEMLHIHNGNSDKLYVYLREARQKGLSILAPSINHSIGRTKLEKGAIRLGLTLVKGIGYQAVQAMLEARKDKPFTSLFDFCLRVPLKQVNRSMIYTLILAGAFDELHNNRASLIASIDEAMEQGELFKEFSDGTGLGVALDVAYVELDEMPIMQKLMAEKEVLGFFISRHPLAEARQTLRSYGYVDIQRVLQHRYKKVRLAAVVQGLKVIRTKKGESMAFATLADELSEMDAVLFPATFRQVNDWLEQDCFVLVEGRTEQRNDKQQLIIDSIEPYHLEDTPFQQQQVYIKVTENKEEMIDKLDQLAEQFPGAAAIYLYREKERQLYKLADSYNIDSSWQVVKQLKQYFGENNVVVKSPSS